MLFIWYPKCSTCKKAKNFLDNNSINYDIQDIKLNPPRYEELEKYLKLSGKDISKFFNTSGMKYRELNLKDKLSEMNEQEKLKLLASDGMLIKRPLLVTDDKVLIGFKENEWSEII